MVTCSSISIRSAARKGKGSTMARTAVVALVVMSAALFVIPGGASAQCPRVLQATVTRVIDGDTIEVSINGRIEQVRYIGINTPEIHHPTRGKEPYREAARAANQRVVEGQTMQLSLDVQQRDRDGRLLAYMYLGGRFINGELVTQGYAEVVALPPNVLHRTELINRQRMARSTHVGLWADPDALTHYRPRGSGVMGNVRIRTYFHLDDSTKDITAIVDKFLSFENIDAAARAGYEPSLNYALHASREYTLLTGRGPAYLEGSDPTLSGTAFSGVMYGTQSIGVSAPGGDVHVRGYVRSDGTYVPPYTRSAPGRAGR